MIICTSDIVHNLSNIFGVHKTDLKCMNHKPEKVKPAVETYSTSAIFPRRNSETAVSCPSCPVENADKAVLLCVLDDSYCARAGLVDWKWVSGKSEVSNHLLSLSTTFGFISHLCLLSFSSLKFFSASFWVVKL